MDSSMHGAGADGGPEDEVNLLIEKGFLLLGSIEFQIDEHLMAHGTRIDPETRFFMAQVRDAAGDAAAKLLDEARSRIDPAPAEQAPAPDGAEATEDAPPPLPVPIAAASRRRDSRDGRRRRVSIRRAVAKATLGTACATLLITILVGGRAERTPQPLDVWTEATPAAETHRLGVLLPGEHPAERAPAKASRPAISATQLAQTVPERPRASAVLVHRFPGTHRAERETQPKPAPWTVTAAIADPSATPPYPDPLAGMEQVAPLEAAAAAEKALALSRGDRREVQRRLALAAFDPQLFDGIFGPATRDALGAWQAAAGLPATGYLTDPALVLLREQTAEEYHDWKAAEAARARREAQTAILSSPVPPASPERANRCRRLPSGKILYGRGVRCDFRGLRESLARLLG